MCNKQSHQHAEECHNPSRSLLFNIPGIMKLEKKPFCTRHKFDMCGFGTRWKKSTQLMFGCCDFDDVAALGTHCCHSRRICAYSGRPHVQLTGRIPGSGKPLTAMAQQYPARLARALARILTLSAQDLIASS